MVDAWDVLVIGAGPAGSQAAKAAALAGAKVLLVERKRRLGALPHCAEFVPQVLGLEFEIPPKTRIQAVNGLETRLGEEQRFLAAPGWILDRQAFDFSLGLRAAMAGAVVWAGTRYLGRRGQKHLLFSNRELKEIRAGAVVAAMGAAPGSARSLGREGQPLLVGVQAVVPLRHSLEHTQVFLESRYQGGYAWLFPRGEAANLGLGCAPRAGAWRLLRALCAEKAAHGVTGPGVLALSSGAIPVGGLLETTYQDSVFFCGDAAGLTHPLTGAGIPQALASGREAGLGAAALAGGDAGAGGDYAHTLEITWRRHLRQGLRARQEMDNAWDKSFTRTMARVWPGWKP